jgi:regulatory protein
MSAVSDIRQSARTGAMFDVYVDGEKIVSLSSLNLSTSGLRVGQDLSLGEIEALRETSETSKAYNAAVHYLSIRPRTRREMTQYLIGKEFHTNQIENVLERLASVGLMNDLEFATSWVRSRQSLHPRSKWRLEQELLAKGVSKDDIHTVFAVMDPDDELSSLVDVIAKKHNIPRYADQSKLITYLTRQGYSYELIKRAFQELEENR